MVIDGKVEVVGSNRVAASSAIDQATRNVESSAAVNAKREGGRVSVTIGAGNGRARVVLVGYDTRRVTPVGRGENAGRTLTESNIVREFTSIGQWTGAAQTLNATSVAGEHLAVLLEASDGAIVGAARVEDVPEGAAR